MAAQQRINDDFIESKKDPWYDSHFSYVIEKLAVLCGPPYLHDPCRDDGDLVVPNPGVSLEGAAHALERRGITSSLKSVKT